MTKRSHYTMLVLILLSACDRVSPAKSPSFNWDLSIDNRIQRVHWPAEVTEDDWLIDGPGTVHFKSRDGVEHDVTFRSAQVARQGGRVKTIRFIRDIGTVNEVYVDAIKLADEWQIKDRADIELFHDTNARRITSGGAGVYGVMGSNELVQGRSLEIRQSFDSASGKPYLSIMQFGFVPDYDAPPATQPTSLPTESGTIR